jgi:hypothetical protein
MLFFYYFIISARISDNYARISDSGVRISYLLQLKCPDFGHYVFSGDLVK